MIILDATAIIGVLDENKADYEVIRQDKPIRSVKDAEGYYDVSKAAPTIVLETDRGLVAYIKSANSGKISFPKLRQVLGCTEIKLASPDSVRQKLGCDVGSVPIVGLSLPTVFDDSLLAFDYVYGGIGDVYLTLRIAPADVKRLNCVIATVK